ncbi:hypothetical protein DBO85_06885 [Pseudomonas mangrovi]|uniref:Uncharacterized protein n=2 Tax=Pseudomonas mangrovi TaxID=2161748 RepID=A0A2T5PB74_9PSED|nr:hypothetical protein DBO85_06885 [Pseudomonas mangrovi]
MILPMTLQPPEYDDPAPLTPQTAADHAGLPAQLLMLGIALLLNLLLAVAIIAAVPQFADVFRNFGAELPLATRLAIQFYPLAAVLPLLIPVAWFVWPNHASRGLGALLTSIACILLVPLAFGYALYLPIFRLGEVV